MKTPIFNLLMAGLFISATILTGCSKNEALNDLEQNPQSLSAGRDANHQEPVEGSSLLNRDLEIIYAVDGEMDITSEFKNVTFNFTGEPPAGRAHASDGPRIEEGSWNWNGFNDVFNIFFPYGKWPQLAFFNRGWNVDESIAGVIRLIANDGDEIHFSAK